MTEAGWLAATDPTPMLEFLRGESSDRKFRLFAVACCHAVAALLIDGRSMRAAEVAERYAEGLASRPELTAVAQSSGEADTELLYSREGGDEQPEFVAACVATWAASNPGVQNYPTMVAQLASQVSPPERLAACARDIFGNPFRPVAFDPAWLTSTVIALAAGIYEDKAFDRMPILADALQDAGCDSTDILNHCRGSGPHVRGCWVVDLILGIS